MSENTSPSSPFEIESIDGTELAFLVACIRFYRTLKGEKANDFRDDFERYFRLTPDLALVDIYDFIDDLSRRTAGSMKPLIENSNKFYRLREGQWFLYLGANPWLGSVLKNNTSERRVICMYYNIDGTPYSRMHVHTREITYDELIKYEADELFVFTERGNLEEAWKKPKDTRFVYIHGVFTMIYTRLNDPNVEKEMYWREVTMKDGVTVYDTRQAVFLDSFRRRIEETNFFIIKENI